MNSSTILQSAIDISQVRGKQYGPVAESFEQIAAAFRAISGLQDFEREHVALMMVLMKLVRAQESPQHVDNYVDGSNYLALYGELQCMGK